LIVTARPWVVVAKAIEPVIPERHERGNKQRFAERNPDIVHEPDTDI
jgi:hypothetical protein